MKTCAQCKEVKPLSSFGKDKHNNDGYNYSCKLCKNKASRSRHKANPELSKKRNIKHRLKRKEYYDSDKGKESSRRSHLKIKFNITLEDYNIMLEAQNGVCAICSNTEMNNVNKVLCVDHNHETKKIRGLLCGKCNTGLGHLNDNIELLINAIKYLKNYET